MHQASFYRGLETVAAALPAAAGAAATAAAAHAAAAALWTAASAPRACRRGCSACCHHPVGIRFAEAVRLLAAIERAPPGLALRQRLLGAAGEGAAWRQLAASRAACPLLQDDCCAVHAERPLPCRALFSADAAACADDLLGVPLPLGVPFEGDAFAAGLGAAAALDQHAGRRGWPEGARELRSALARLLQLPNGAGEAAMAAAFAGALPAGDDAAAEAAG